MPQTPEHRTPEEAPEQIPSFEKGFVYTLVHGNDNEDLTMDNGQRVYLELVYDEARGQWKAFAKDMSGAVVYGVRCFGDSASAVYQELMTQVKDKLGIRTASGAAWNGRKKEDASGDLKIKG